MRTPRRSWVRKGCTWGLLGFVGVARLAGATGTRSGAADLASLGANVHVFKPSMPQAGIQSTIDRIAKHQRDNQFGRARYALLFEAGTYGSERQPLVIPVGYYTQVAGLGASPGDVIINGTVQVRNRCIHGACVALDNFWRSLSNLTVRVASTRTACDAGEIWAVSQASAMRRVSVTGGDVRLSDECTRPGYASGGYIADSVFSNLVVSGTQQQFMVRNVEFAGWRGGGWNQVFSGVKGAPGQCFPATPSCGPYTTVSPSPVTREMPFLFRDPRGGLQVFVPAMERGTSGASWAHHPTTGTAIALTRFFVAMPGDSASRINAALAAGQHLLLSPGVYHLEQSLRVERAGTVVLGLGLPTLKAEQGVIAMRVAATRGVSVSGLLFEAGAVSSPELLRVGESSASADDAADAADPSALHDVYFRIGGAGPGKAAVSLTVNSNHTILDHLWAWRADHGRAVGWAGNTADTGVIVNGQGVVAYGLFVEHFQKHEVIWNGEDGTVLFYQNEMPYDPPSQAAWAQSATEPGWAAFKVAGTVKRFRGYGMGSYSYFNRGVEVFAARAFEVPATLAPGSLTDLFTLFLNPTASGGILRVVNDQGGSSTRANPDAPVVVTRYP